MGDFVRNPYQICTKTVLDSSYPGISFDENGVSNHYWEFERTLKSKWLQGLGDPGRLQQLAESIKGSSNNSEFDCIIGLSGGLDSSYLLHYVVTELGLKPLVFHVDGGWNSEEAVHNIRMLVEKLKLDLYTEVINWNEMRDFQLAMLRSGVPHLDIPQDHAFISVLYKFAEKHKIKVILNGGNIATESIRMPYDLYYWGTDMRQIKDILDKFGSLPMRSYPFSSVYRHKIYLRYVKKIKTVKLLNFIEFDKVKAISKLQQIYDWKAYPQKHFESIFTRFYEGYILPTRFGFDVRRCQMSSLILSGQMSRTEAIAELEVPSYSEDLLRRDKKFVANKLRLSPDELDEMLLMPKKFFWDYKNQNQILRVVEKLLNATGIARRGGAF